MLILGSLFWTTTQGGAPPSPVVVDAGPQPSGGIPHVPRRRRTQEEIDREREALGIIEKVAHRQAEALSIDSQQQLEELSRELELKNIEWKGQYLELLAQKREALISQEIAFRMRQLQRQEDETMLALLLTTL